MTASMDAADWDARYATAELVWTAAPNTFLVSEVDGLLPGRALDLACGEGRNAVWLAEQGWASTGVDFSAVGLSKADQLARDRGVTVEWICADVTRGDTPARGRFDLVVVLYLQVPATARRRALHGAAACLAPGGTLPVVAHDRDHLEHGVGGPQDPAVLYGPDDVVSDLAAGEPALEVVRAATVERNVAGADRPALDCLVRARRT